MFKLFFCEVSDEISELPSEISEHRKEKILSSKSEKNKKLQIAAASVLKAGFSSFDVEEKDVTYGTLENGKPIALSHPEIHFSLSHSENMAVAVFSDTPVGVDCERKDRTVSLDLIKHFFLPEEVEDYKNDPPLLWVAGESLSKLSGEGVFAHNNRTRIPPFVDENTTKADDVILEKRIIGDNIVVVSYYN